jgi:hypothetical protein
MPSSRIQTTRKAAPSKSQLPIIGKVKVGKKTTNSAGVLYPTSTDYFVATSDNPNFLSMFSEAYGEKPKALEIMFVSDNLYQSCHQRFECRDKSGRLTGYGDGVEIYIWDVKAKEYLLQDAESSLVKQAGKWDMVLTMRFLLTKIRGLYGVWEFSTKAEKSSIPQIIETFDLILDRVGSVLSVPFELTVEKVVSNKPGVSDTFPVVKLVPNLSVGALDTVKRFLTEGRGELPLLLTEETARNLLTERTE